MPRCAFALRRRILMDDDRKVFGLFALLTALALAACLTAAHYYPGRETQQKPPDAETEALVEHPKHCYTPTVPSASEVGRAGEVAGYWLRKATLERNEKSAREVGPWPGPEFRTKANAEQVARSSQVFGVQVAGGTVIADVSLNAPDRGPMRLFIYVRQACRGGWWRVTKWEEK